MKLEDQVKCTSLKLSQELEKAGYEQEGVWCWAEFCSNKVYLVQKDKINDDVYTFYIAPTVAELGERLPSYIENGNRHLSIHKTKDGYIVGYEDGYGSSSDSEQVDISIANAMAKCWLYLKKEGVI